MGRLDDIQTALKPLKISEKIEIHFYDHFKTTPFYFQIKKSEVQIKKVTFKLKKVAFKLKKVTFKF